MDNFDGDKANFGPEAYLWFAARILYCFED